MRRMPPAAPRLAPAPLRDAHGFVVVGALRGEGEGGACLGAALRPGALPRPVALERLPVPHAAAAAALSYTARLVARVRHPHLLPPLELHVDAHEALLVSEYVHGVTLGELVAAAREARAPLPPEIGGAIVAAALRGLEAVRRALGRGGARSDGATLAPERVLIGADGEVKLRAIAAPAAGPARLGDDLAADLAAAASLLEEVLPGPEAPPTGGSRAAVVAGRLREAAARATAGFAGPAGDGERADDPPSLGGLAAAIEEAAGAPGSAEIGALVTRVAASALARREALLAALDRARPEGEPPSGRPPAAGETGRGRPDRAEASKDLAPAAARSASGRATALATTLALPGVARARRAAIVTSAIGLAALGVAVGLLLPRLAGGSGSAASPAGGAARARPAGARSSAPGCRPLVAGAAARGAPLAEGCW